MKQRIINYTDRIKDSYIFLYSIFFIIIFLFGFNDFLFIQGKSFIWYLDGTKQHFAFLYDWAQIVKDILQKSQDIPLWSWQLGIGGDIIHSYSYYIVGDPLSFFVALLFPLSKIELGYSIMVVVRLFLVGLSLLFYCKYMGLRQMPSVIGSLVYALSGHILFWGMRHPFFINSAIILPVLFISIEEIFAQRKSPLFILCIAFSAINSFYFAYMNTIAIIMYAVIRFFYYVQVDRKKAFIKLFFKVLGFYILGLAIGSFLFIPAIYGFLTTYRVPTDLKPDLLVDLRSCLQMFARFIIMDYEQGIPRVSIAAISFPVILLFLGLKDRLSNSFKFLFGIFITFLCLPFMHSVFNGFSAPNDRWVYIYICIVSFIVAYTLNNMGRIENKNNIHGSLFAFSYLGIIYCEITITNFVLVISGFYCFVLSFYRYNSGLLKYKEKLLSTKLLEVGVLFLVTVNLITNINALMSTKNYGGEFSKYNSVLQEYTSHKTAFSPPIEEDVFYRVDYADTSDNRSVVNNFNGTHIYNSIIDKDIIEFYNFNRLRTRLGTSAYMGFDEISPLNFLMGVRYYVEDKDEKHMIPYGFHLTTEVEGVITYENKNEVSLGFVYENYILKKDITAFNGVDKIYAMLDGVVLEEPIDTVIRRLPEKASKELDYIVVSDDGVKMSENNAFVSKKDGSVQLKVNHTSGNEIFLLMNRVYFQDENQNFKITVETSQIKKAIETRSVRNTYYVDNRDYMYHLGYEEAEDLLINIRFSNKGEYVFNELSFLGVDMNHFNSKVDDLTSSEFKDVKYGSNAIRGNVKTENHGILFLSIPHTPGWKVYVDGKEEKTFKVNTAFIGVELEKGEHKVLLKYTTPYMIPCIVVSITGVLILIAILFFNVKKIKKLW